jgi:uncharacterized protein (DUF58 family)
VIENIHSGLKTFQPSFAPVSPMKQVLKNLVRHFYLTRRFFLIFGISMLIFVVAYAFPAFFAVAQVVLTVAILMVFVDMFLIFRNGITLNATRKMAKMLSLGDANIITLLLDNPTSLSFKLEIIDELPFQFQKRDFSLKINIKAGEKRRVPYELTPVTRGEYAFGNINLIATSGLGLVARRFQSAANQVVPVYPSVIQMKKFELMALRSIAHQDGVKKMRRIGHSYEFDQIKNYVAGDDYRAVNWKASSRRGELMVNQYEDERAQQIYCIIDKSRVMRMPFGGLTLLDHAINTALVISNVILQKKDKVGLLSFSNILGTTLAADNTPNQLNRILNELYKEKEGKGEASYEMLYYAVRRLIKGRSLLLFFTNFESIYALERVLPTLRLLNNQHLLVVVFFENTEISTFSKQESKTTEAIFHHTIAQQYVNDKVQMVQKLRQYGIQTILTKPEELSINTLNKYLELKSRGLI